MAEAVFEAGDSTSEESGLLESGAGGFSNGRILWDFWNGSDVGAVGGSGEGESVWRGGVAAEDEGVGFGSGAGDLVGGLGGCEAGGEGGGVEFGF